MLDDTSRITRHTLMKWIEKKGQNLYVSTIYVEFDQIYNWLPSVDQWLFDGDKVLLFCIKAIDKKIVVNLATF